MTETMPTVPLSPRSPRRDARQIAQLLRQIVGDRFCFWLVVLERLLDARDWLRRRGRGPRR